MNSTVDIGCGSHMGCWDGWMCVCVCVWGWRSESGLSFLIKVDLLKVDLNRLISLILFLTW